MFRTFCGGCTRKQPNEAFSIRQIKKSYYKRRCNECVSGTSPKEDYNTTVQTEEALNKLKCSVCLLHLHTSQFSASQQRKGDLRKCTTCIHTPSTTSTEAKKTPSGLKCSRCKQHLDKLQFSKSQQRKMDKRKCKVCVKTQPLSSSDHDTKHLSYLDRIFMSNEEKFKHYGIDNRSDIKQFITAIQNGNLTEQMIQESTFCNICLSTTKTVSLVGPKKLCQQCKQLLEGENFPTEISLQEIAKIYEDTSAVYKMTDVTDFVFYANFPHLFD